MSSMSVVVLMVKVDCPASKQSSPSRMPTISEGRSEVSSQRKQAFTAFLCSNRLGHILSPPPENVHRAPDEA